MFDTRAFHHRFLISVGGLAGEGFPALLPGSEQAFSFFKAALSGSLHLAGSLELRLKLGQRGCQFIGLRLVAGQNGFRLHLRGRSLVEVRALPSTQVLGELQTLFGTGDFGTQLVMPRLHATQGFLTRGSSLARLFHGCFCRTQRGHRCLQGQFAFAERMPTPFGFGIKVAQAQSQKFGVELAFLFLEALIATRCGRLPLQMTQLLVYFVTQVIQALEIFAGAGNAALRLFPAFLVTGDARGLFDEAAHLFGLRGDDTRDHALFDDGVTAAAKARAEEQLRDVLAAALATVDEIRRGAIARHLALQRNLGERGIGTGDGAVGVVEDQLDGGRTHRFAGIGAVEDDVVHRFAAQVLGGNFAHDPAHGIDDVGLAATIGTHDPGEVVREVGSGRVDERLEAGDLELGQTHPGTPVDKRHSVDYAPPPDTP